MVVCKNEKCIQWMIVSDTGIINIILADTFLKYLGNFFFFFFFFILSMHDNSNIFSFNLVVKAPAFF